MKEPSKKLPKVVKKRKIGEVVIPRGIENGPIKCRKILQPYSPPELFVLNALMGFIGMRGSGKSHGMEIIPEIILPHGTSSRPLVIDLTSAEFNTPEPPLTVDLSTTSDDEDDVVFITPQLPGLAACCPFIRSVQYPTLPTSGITYIVFW